MNVDEIVKELNGNMPDKANVCKLLVGKSVLISRKKRTVAAVTALWRTDWKIRFMW